MQIQSGYPFYGQTIGVLVFDQKTPRIPGDPGHNGTFPYPVCYEVVQGGFAQLIDGTDEVKAALIQGALALKAKGVKAILGDCGLMSLYQQELSAATNLPVFASALSLIPLLYTICAGRTIGILTGHSQLLKKTHLVASGWREEISLAIEGLENDPHFAKIVIGGHPDYLPDLMRQDVLAAMARLQQKSPDLGAVIIECSNLPTYSRDLYQATGVPVFDIASAADILWRSVTPPQYI